MDNKRLMGLLVFGDCDGLEPYTQEPILKEKATFSGSLLVCSGTTLKLVSGVLY